MAADVQVTVSGELNWHGHVLRCGDCGSSSGWRLRAYEEMLRWHPAGEDAVATCAACQQDTGHPLVYPGMVRALANHARGTVLSPEDAARVLDGIRWRPHGAHCQFPGADPAPVEYLFHEVILWLPWEEPWDCQRSGAYPEGPWYDWHKIWPELLAAVNGLPIPQPRR